jgi:DNA-binding response OmpR family regulator
MSAKRSILVVDDDPSTREMLGERLADDHGFAVRTAGSLDAAEKAINDEQCCFDAVILDLGMPDGNGCDYCTQLRRQGHNMPVIMLTGSRDEDDVVRGLSSGANDYIAKPFRFSELLARLRAQLREFERSEDATFPVGPYIFRPSKKLLQDTAAQRHISLTAKEAALLKFLYRSHAAVDRQKLLREVWGYKSAITTQTLETHIHRLRRKMEPDPARPELLVTEHDGYRLNHESAPLVECDSPQQRVISGQ